MSVSPLSLNVDGLAFDGIALDGNYYEVKEAFDCRQRL
jgi:hypothetical protein